jgi:hypothetical protein
MRQGIQSRVEAAHQGRGQGGEQTGAMLERAEDTALSSSVCAHVSVAVPARDAVRNGRAQRVDVGHGAGASAGRGMRAEVRASHTRQRPFSGSDHHRVF